MKRCNGSVANVRKAPQALNVKLATLYLIRSRIGSYSSDCNVMLLLMVIAISLTQKADQEQFAWYRTKDDDTLQKSIVSCRNRALLYSSSELGTINISNMHISSSMPFFDGFDDNMGNPVSLVPALGCSDGFNSNDVLHNLPPPSIASQHYNLRHRTHIYVFTPRTRHSFV